MSAKKTIFPQRQPGLGREDIEDEDELYTGHPDFSGTAKAPAEDNVPRTRAKGHAAYASYGAQDEMPPYVPPGAGSNPLGGLFADESAGAAQAPGDPRELLTVIPQDVLEAECQQRVCPSCAVQKDADDARLRALADLDNAKKRLAREKEEQVRYAAEVVLSDLIPSLDNIDRALEHAKTHEATKDFVVGVRMTRKLMQEALAKNGLHEVGEVGEEFNPAVHEAVGMVDAPGLPDGHVCELLAKGYVLNERLLRPAKVVVCKKSG